MHFPDKLGMAAGAPPGLQVCQVIADKPGFGNIDVHIRAALVRLIRLI